MARIKSLNYSDLSYYLLYDYTTGKIYRKRNKYKGKTGDEVGYPRKDGYFYMKWNGKTTSCARIAYTLFYGKAPDNQIDHMDGNVANNKIENLRDTDYFGNMSNRKMNTGGKYLAGVYKNGKGFAASLKSKGKIIRLGTFKTEQEAHNAYVRAKATHHGAFRRAI